MQATLLVSHGSRSEDSLKEIRELTERLKAQGKLKIVHFAFLDVQEPSIPAGIDLCVKDGAKEIFVLQHFLNSGNHVKKDIPALIEKARQKYPDIRFTLSQPIGLHPSIAESYLDMLKGSS